MAHPLLGAAFDTLAAEYQEALLACSAKDDLGRYRLAEAMKTISAVRRHLATVVETGKIARRHLASLQDRRFF